MMNDRLWAIKYVNQSKRAYFLAYDIYQKSKYLMPPQIFPTSIKHILNLQIISDQYLAMLPKQHYIKFNYSRKNV